MNDFCLLLYMYTNIVVAKSTNDKVQSVLLLFVDRIEQGVITSHVALGPAEPSQNGLVWSYSEFKGVI